MTITCSQCATEYEHELPSLHNPGTAECPNCGHQVRIEIANPEGIDDAEGHVKKVFDDFGKTIEKINKRRRR